jgi:hypothetical protein
VQFGHWNAAALDAARAVVRRELEERAPRDFLCGRVQPLEGVLGVPRDRLRRRR